MATAPLPVELQGAGTGGLRGSCQEYAAIDAQHVVKRGAQQREQIFAPDLVGTPLLVLSRRTAHTILRMVDAVVK